MASKIFAQIIIYSTQVVTRAFVDAYRQAAANASRAGSHAAKQAADASSTVVGKAKTSFGGMTIAEARQILHVRDNASKDDIQRSYEHLFKVNEKSEGGSFYLQSKVVRAKEALDWYENQIKLEAEAKEKAEKQQKEQEEAELAARAREMQERLRKAQEDKKGHDT